MLSKTKINSFAVNVGEVFQNLDIKEYIPEFIVKISHGLISLDLSGLISDKRIDSLLYQLALK